MLDIKFIRDNPDAVRENIKKKFQDAKLPLVDQVLELDQKNRTVIAEAQQLRTARNALSKQVGMLMGQAKKDPSKLQEAEEAKAQVKANADRLAQLEQQETELAQEIRKIMLVIPNIIDPSVPIGPDDSANVEVERFGEAVNTRIPLPHPDHGELPGRGYGRRGPGVRQRLLLSDGRYCPAPRGGAGLRPRFYDCQGLHVLHPPLHDSRQRGRGGYEPDGHGRYDVQDRGRGPGFHPSRHRQR